MSFSRLIFGKYIKYFALPVVFFSYSAFCELKLPYKPETVDNHIPFADNPGYVAGGRPFNWIIKDENGREFSIDNFAGSVVVVAIFTTWCPNCPIVLQGLDTLVDKLGNLGVKNVKVVALNVGDESINSLKIHYKANDIQMLEVYHSISPTVIKDIRGVPACFVFDKRGAPVCGYFGAAEYGSDEFIEFIKWLLEK
jgi:thiol-disulfide isomerase/thioredoxin